jgi:hypothetical protein
MEIFNNSRPNFVCQLFFFKNIIYTEPVYLKFILTMGFKMSTFEIF